MSLRRVAAGFLLIVLAGATLMACDPPSEDGGQTSPSYEQDLNALALAIKADHPKHYECREYLPTTSYSQLL